jgi:hypothetical protein
MKRGQFILLSVSPLILVATMVCAAGEFILDLPRRYRELGR